MNNRLRAVARHRKVSLASLSIVLALILGACSGGGEPSTSEDRNASEIDLEVPSAPSEIRVGWTPAWTNSANAMQVLNRTDIAASNGLTIRSEEFLAGGPASQAFLAGDIDVAILGDAPAFQTLAAAPGATVIGVAGRSRGALIVKRDSPLEGFDQLAGKRVGAFVSSGVWAQLKAWEADAELDKPLSIVNLEPAAWGPALQRGSIDAYMAWDPFIAVAQDDDNLRVLHDDNTPVGLLVASDEILRDDPAAVVRFLAAYQQALLFSAIESDTVYPWTADKANMSVEQVRFGSQQDPFSKAKTLADVALSIPDESMAYEEKAIGILADAGYLKDPPKLTERTAQDLIDLLPAYHENHEFTVEGVTVK